MTPLREELSYYAATKADLLKAHVGKFVAISGERLIGVFDTAEKAYESGVTEVGNGSFLVRQVLPEDPVITAPAVFTGLITLGT